MALTRIAMVQSKSRLRGIVIGVKILEGGLDSEVTALFFRVLLVFYQSHYPMVQLRHVHLVVLRGQT